MVQINIYTWKSVRYIYIYIKLENIERIWDLGGGEAAVTELVFSLS